ncbi:F-box protein [Pyrus ussuriensis x Pyrus communis]|uniref:F-box protein n=1 Tax=Pyrus ussuriensis x Pyrus communis TaxID=2448454 RepID=A0A5N5F361_9ROSA|nr:F-box protein [Pyrus ussuriensis x Pyrus communis]
MVCKKFNQLRFERVDPLTSWRRHEEVYKFLERCIECNNPELGIESLKMMISKGHRASTYVYDAILVCEGGDEKEKGLNLLHYLNW